MEFRSENFPQFIRKMKPPYYWWLLLFGLFGALTLNYFKLFHKNQGQFWVSEFIIVTGFLLISGWLFGFPYRVYLSGRKAVANLGEQPKEILNDVEVYIKSFDLFGSKKMFPPDASRPIYDFERADIVLAGQSLILLGKSEHFGSLLFAAPVELTPGRGQTIIAQAKIMKWTERNGRIAIEIDDPNYKDKIEIEFKNEIDTLRQWLIRQVAGKGS